MQLCLPAYIYIRLHPPKHEQILRPPLSGEHPREFDSCILEKVVAGIDLPAFFVSNFMFYLVVISGNSIENMIY